LNLALELWDNYTEYKAKMFAQTNTSDLHVPSLVRGKNGKSTIQGLKCVLTLIFFKKLNK
jgi:polyphosphate kinase 2 (PPK2 family)